MSSKMPGGKSYSGNDDGVAFEVEEDVVEDACVGVEVEDFKG